MESRGESGQTRAKVRPAIVRRSCDQCRARKIGCDRASPCSNCINARVDCTHSVVASNTTIAPKQRVLVSAKYEQKLDGIAEDIGGIKLLLQGLNVSSGENQPMNRSQLHHNQAGSAKPLKAHQSISTSKPESPWDHSAHIVDFVRAVLEDRNSRNFESESKEVLLSLKNLVKSLDDPPTPQAFPPKKIKPVMNQANPHMPPLEAVVMVLRWAKDHEGFTRVNWLSQILPLQTFTDICRKVYFAVEEYSEVDFILANGYLSYIFSEYVVSELEDYGEYCQICRENLQDSLSRFPLLSPTSIEAVAALTLGTFNAIENSKATVAWKFISAAADLCQTLGYHRLRRRKEHDQPLRAVQERLFWTVYAIEKGLSLRLGRSSNIRDDEITLPLDPDEPRATKLGRINGLVYDQLYSHAGLSRPDSERGNAAKTLAGDLRKLIGETRAEILDANNQPSGSNLDPMQALYLKCDLVCQSSLLALILRAIPTPQSSGVGSIDDCVTPARDALEMHEQCMRELRGYQKDPFMVTKYINWAILYCPFAPFSILFTRTVQLLDAADLARLDRFADSLQLENKPAKVITHPYRLYKLLCQAARLYFQLDSSSPPGNPSITYDLADPWAEFDFAQAGIGAGAAADESGPPTNELYDWSLDSHQFMGMLNEELMF